MRKLILTAALLAAAPALAQQEPSASDRAMSDRIVQEVSANITCRGDVYRLQAELAKAQARIKELEDAKKEAK